MVFTRSGRRIALRRRRSSRRFTLKRRRRRIRRFKRAPIKRILRKQIFLHKTKCSFEVFSRGSTEGNEVRIGVCFNGRLSDAAGTADDGVFQFVRSDDTFRDGTTGTLFPNDQFPVEFANVWDRRRIAGIKMKYMPYYSNFPAGTGQATANTAATEVYSAFQIPHMAIAWDRDGLELDLTDSDYDDVRGQAGKTKSVRLDRPFKIYRKSTLFPTFQKFPYNNEAIGNTTQATDIANQRNIWGMWQQEQTGSAAAKDVGIVPSGDPDGSRVFHIMMISKPILGVWDQEDVDSRPIGQFDCTVYHVLADRR